MIDLSKGQLWQLIKCAKSEDEWGAAKMAFQVSITPDVLASVLDELESVKAEKQAILKFINDSCYVFDGEDGDYSDGYVDAISHSMMPSVDYTGIEGVRKP